MTSLRRISALCLASALALAGCESSPSQPELEFEGSRVGSLSFTYSGALTGSYSVSGKYQEDATGNVERVPFAIGIRYFEPAENEDFFDVFSFAPRAGANADILNLRLEAETTVGETLSLNQAACITGQRLNENCAVGIFAFNVDPDDVGDGDVWMAVDGTLRVDALTRFNMRGTFSATIRNLVTQQQVTITNGTFDVPVINERDTGRFSVSPQARVPAFSRAPGSPGRPR